MQSMKKILVVEDDIAMNTILRDFLSKQGYSVTTVNSATGALSLLKSLSEKKRPDLILSDIKLGAVSGIDLVQRVTRDYPALPVVLFSVFDQIEKEALASGAKRFLKKPFSLEKLRKVLAEELGRESSLE